MNKNLVIGLTGPNGSGKGEVSKYLERKGFVSFSLSDIIREELYKKNIEITRENLINEGNSLRKKYGPGILAKKIKNRLKKRSVVDSIRNVAEIKELRKIKNFILLGIDASPKLRFKRIIKRNREKDPLTFKEFLLNEKKENSRNKTFQQISECMKLCDYVINNNSTIRNLYKKIDSIIKNYENKKT